MSETKTTGGTITDDEIRALTTALATTTAERDALRGEVSELRARLAEREGQLDTQRGQLDSECTEHVELNGHLDIAEQALDWMAVEMRGDAFDTKVQDFRKSLRIVIDQCEKQRRRANWYICAYDSGRAKLVEHWQAQAAEAIAAWLDERWKQYRSTLSRDVVAALAYEIRSGSWRKGFV